MAVRADPAATAVEGKLAMGGEPAARFDQALPLERPSDDPLAGMRATREADRAAARSDVENSGAMASLRRLGEQLKTIGTKHAEARQTVNADQTLSPVGKAERHGRLHDQFAQDLETLGQSYGQAEDELLGAFSGKGEASLTASGARKTEDANRVSAIASVLPSWPPARAIELVRQAAADGDRVLLQHAWPVVEGLAESDPRWRDARGEVAALQPDVELALSDRATFARDHARERADEMRAAFHAAGMQVARAGGWDPVFDPTLAPFRGAADDAAGA